MRVRTEVDILPLARCQYWSIYSVHTRRIGYSPQERDERMETTDIDHVGGAGKTRRIRQKTSIGRNAHRRQPVVVLKSIAIGKLNQLVLPTSDPAGKRTRALRAFEEKSIVWRAGFESIATAVEVRFFQIGAVVLGAERVAIAAVVAVVGEVRDLIGLLQLEQFFVADGHDTAIRTDFHISVSESNFARMVGEVGIIRTNRNAFVARDAIERDQVRIDFLWHRTVLGGVIPRVGLRFRHNGRHIQKAGE